CCCTRPRWPSSDGLASRRRWTPTRWPFCGLRGRDALARFAALAPRGFQEAERLRRFMSLGYLRVMTAGESHGPQLTIFVQNLPAGLPIEQEAINRDLQRRQKGYGRGGRQRIEHDEVEIVAGVRHGRTMGGPIAMVVKN